MSAAIVVHLPASSAIDAWSRVEEDHELLRLGRGGIGHGAGLLELEALVHEHRRVAAVVEQHVRAAVRPGQRLLGAPPVLGQRLALPREHRHAARLLGRPVRADGDRRGGVILGREDVARRPPHLGAERDERLDQHGGLDRHVQRAGDAGPAKRLLRTELACASTSGRASRARRSLSPCGRTPRARDPQRGSRWPTAHELRFQSSVSPWRPDATPRRWRAENFMVER